MPQFDVSMYCVQIIWLIITFSFFYLFSLLYVLPNLRKIFQERKNSIYQDKKLLNQLDNELQKLYNLYNKINNKSIIENKYKINNANKKLSYNLSQNKKNVYDECKNNISNLLLYKDSLNNVLELSNLDNMLKMNQLKNISCDLKSMLRNINIIVTKINTRL